jgi:hypothetical protein
MPPLLHGQRSARSEDLLTTTPSSTAAQAERAPHIRISRTFHLIPSKGTSSVARFEVTEKLSVLPLRKQFVGKESTPKY